jgi:putative nucleotidyltransferase with HDIG domain
MDRKTVFKKLDKVNDLPTLPVIAMEVNKMLGDDGITISSLSQVIEKDQAIVSKLLRLVNSAFFGLRSKVSSIQEAVVLLGFNTIRNVVLSVSVINSFSGADGMEAFDISEFWKHSIGVAMLGKALSEKTQAGTPDESFLSGLLHDMGKIVQLQVFPDIFKTILSTAHENEFSFYEAEKKENYMDHSKIGGYLAQKWQLPSHLTDAINRHHLFGGTSTPDLVMVIHTADIMAHAFLEKAKNPKMLSKIHPDAFRKMKPAISSMSEWLMPTIGEIENAWEFFLEKDTGK